MWRTVYRTVADVYFANDPHYRMFILLNGSALPDHMPDVPDPMQNVPDPMPEVPDPMPDVPNHMSDVPDPMPDTMPDVPDPVLLRGGEVRGNE